MKKIIVIIGLFLIYIINTAYGAEKKVKIVFINPGFQKEEYWSDVSGFMKAAADDFKMEIEIIYADRDHFKMVEIAKKIAARKIKPDYLICVNEKRKATEIIEIADKAKIKTLLILNDLTEEQKKKYKNPREKYKHWIGTIIPDNIKAGELIANSILDEMKKNKIEKIKIAGISGVKATPAIMEREIGFNNVLKQRKDIEFKQLVNGELTAEDGYAKCSGLLSRYPDINAIWCANDLIAEGALKASYKKEKIVGSDIFISGLNWSKKGIEMVSSKELTATVGGHFMVGGWVVVMINDYEKGIDFADEGLELRLDCFDIINQENVEKYQKILTKREWSTIDFKKFSKEHNSNLKKYNFTIKSIMRELSK